MAYHVLTLEATYGADQTTLMCCNYYGCRTADTRSCLEHSRPYALWDHCLSGPSAGKPTDHREGKSSFGETSLVREPMAGEVSGCSCCRSWPRAFHAGDEVG